LQCCEIEADVYPSLGDKVGETLTENRSRGDVEFTPQCQLDAAVEIEDFDPEIPLA
jgi:hypothetical protein